MYLGGNPVEFRRFFPGRLPLQALNGDTQGTFVITLSVSRSRLVKKSACRTQPYTLFALCILYIINSLSSLPVQD